MKTLYLTVLCYVALSCGFARAQGRDFTIGGIVTNNPTSLVGGVANVNVSLECQATGSIEVATNEIGIWFTEVFSEDTCVITFDTSETNPPPGFTGWDLYQQREFMPGQYRTYMALDPLCTTARAPEDSLTFFTDPNDPSSAQNIVTHAAFGGTIPCENCGKGPYNWLPGTTEWDGTCQSGDWYGDGLVTVVTDLEPLSLCLFFGLCSDICYWAADMNGDYMLTFAGDVPPFEQHVAYNNPDVMLTCQEVTGDE